MLCGEYQDLSAVAVCEWVRCDQKSLARLSCFAQRSIKI
jgi:hypothetical protein